MNTISVIVPVFNSELRIAKTIKSILNQSIDNIEIIIVDDGSTDNSLKICKEIALNENSIRVIHQENSGVSSARNTGVMHSKGKYISFVDADDWIEPSMLESMLTSIERSKSQICMTNIVNEIEGENFKTELGIPSGLYTGRLIIDKIIANMLSPKSLDSNTSSIMGSVCRLLISRDLIEKNKISFNSQLTYMEDLVYCLELFLKAKSIYINDDFHYHYVQNRGSAVFSYNRNLKDQIELSDFLIQKLLIECNLINEFEMRLGIRKVLFTQTLIINELHKDNTENNSVKLKTIKKYLQGDEITNIIDSIDTSHYTLRKRIVLSLIRNKSSWLVYLYYSIVVKYVIK